MIVGVERLVVVVVALRLQTVVIYTRNHVG